MNKSSKPLSILDEVRQILASPTSSKHQWKFYIDDECQELVFSVRGDCVLDGLEKIDQIYARGGGAIHHAWLVDYSPKPAKRRQASLVAINEQGQKWYCFMVPINLYFGLN